MKHLILLLLLVAPLYAAAQTPRLLIDSSENARDPQPPLGDYAMWIGVAHMDAWGGELGLRYKAFGLTIGTPELGRGDDLPEYYEYEIPHSGYNTERFKGGHNGIMLLYFHDLWPSLALYGGAGVYWKTDFLLDHSTATGWYYENPANPDLHSGSFAAALGIQLTLFRHFLIGVAGNSVAGIVGQIGARF